MLIHNLVHLMGFWPVLQNPYQYCLNLCLFFNDVTVILGFQTKLVDLWTLKHGYCDNHVFVVLKLVEFV